MINVNEIRVGSWVTLENGSKEPFQITVRSFKRLDESGVADYDPILLTHEILLACGFEFTGFKDHVLSISPFDGLLKELCFAGDYLYLREGNLNERRDRDSLCVLWNKDLIKTFYLHQLQNLYFCLTGTELKYNP